VESAESCWQHLQPVQSSYYGLFVCRVISALNGRMRAPWNVAPLIRFLILALYIYCLLVYIVCFPTCPFFFTFSLRISSLTYSVSRPDVVKGD